jgi:acyl-coenzyme A thioesterase PaaI-like protein
MGFQLPRPEREGADRYETTFSFDERHQGGPGLVHGGLVAALLDEVCGLLVTWYRFPSVTGRMFLHYRRPVPINRALLARAFVEETKGRRVYIRGELVDGGEPLAEARMAFVHVPLEHFLGTPEGRAAGEAWRRRLGVTD